MEPKENLCQPPEYPAGMFSKYIESAKARALRASEIEAILGDEYDLDRLRELVEADRDGRCVVLPCKKGEILPRYGRKYKADHWNVVLTAFADDETAPNGKLLELFSVEDAKAALKGDHHENL